MQEQTNQETKAQHMMNKATSIVASKRVRRTSNRHIWIVSSGNPKTPNKWYCVQWSEEVEAFLCDCPAFMYCPAEDREGKPYCCHLLAAALLEGGGL
jgi:hypothetical protein